MIFSVSEELKNKDKDKTDKNKIIIKYSSKEVDSILFNQCRAAEACKTVMGLTLYEKELGSEEVY